MSLEIEHKYMVVNDLFRNMIVREFKISQGYLSRDPERIVRVRIQDDKGCLTVKGRTDGDIRQEFEYGIPIGDARVLLDLCERPVLEKIRYHVEFDGWLWEVDEYLGELAPLIVAEIELPSSDSVYPIPPFVGKNVTGDPRYYNSNLLLRSNT